MIKDSTYLIVYGTLRPFFTNSHAQFLREHSHYVGEATFPGILFDLGDYPGATYQPGGVTHVSGTVYDISDHQLIILAYLDNYEGIGAEFDQPTEYVRRLIPVYCLDKVFNCWIYLYNYSIAGKLVITFGDYSLYSRKGYNN